MTKEDYVKDLTSQKYSQYDIKIPIDQLPWSGEFVETKLNTGEIELVDRLVEFVLCAAHSYYFIDRYCFTLDPQKGPIPLKLFTFQKSILNDFQTHSKIIFRKSRQIGASILSGSYALWRANFHKAQVIKIVSLNLTDALEFKEKTIDINYYDMPGFLKTKTTRDGFNKTKLKLTNQSHIRSLSKSKNAGRGGTPSLIILDEAAFNEWMDDIWKAIEPSLDKGGDCIIISTTNGVGNWYHLTYTRAEQGLNEFHPIYVPWWKYPGRDNAWLTDIEENKVEDVHSFTKQKEAEQLSFQGDPKDGPWLWKRRANSKTQKDFQQEILADFLGSGETVATFKTILRLQAEIKEPKWVDRLPADNSPAPIPSLWCWADKKENSLYMLAADTATGNGKDFSSFHVIDIYEKEQVAEYKYQVPTDTFGEIIKRVARYYNSAYVVIETNHPGPAVFNEVVKSKTDPYHNVYMHRKAKDFVSWETTTKSRVSLIEDYFKDLENAITKTYSSRFLEEVKVFNWSESGKAEALKGYNDDLIISFAIYAHLREKSFSSRPVGISSSKTKSFDPTAELEEIEIDNMSDRIKELTGVDADTYFWLQGKYPEKYIKLKRELMEDNQKPPDWLTKKVRGY